MISLKKFNEIRINDIIQYSTHGEDVSLVVVDVVSRLENDQRKVGYVAFDDGTCITPEDNGRFFRLLLNATLIQDQ